MRLSVSNIAWDLREEEPIARFLASEGVDRIDIAPGKYFSDPEAVAANDLAAVRRLWEDRGFRIEGMQALLFGTTGLNLFGDADGRMFRRLAAVCRIAGGVGVRALTFGSPRQRDRSGLDDAEAERQSVAFLRRLGDVARNEGVVFCLEPNPIAYGCNFMTDTRQAAAIVEAVAHPAIRLQLDVGALTMNAEPVAETIARYAPLTGHVHASEPLLAILGDGGSDHGAAADALADALPDHVVTIEMAPPKAESPLDAVRRAVALAKRTYGAAG